MMPPFDARLVSDLWFFTVAAESETLEAAASRLAVTQSAVTQRIKRLEERLDAELFVRDGRRLRLNPAGKALSDAASGGFARIREAVEKIGSVKPRPFIKVSCTPSLAIGWLTPALPEFLARHPEISVALFAEMDGIDRNLMARQQIDLAIRYGPAPPPDVHVLYSVCEPVMPVASPELAYRMRRDPGLVMTLLHDAKAWENAGSPTVEWDRWIDRHGPLGSEAHRDLFFNLAHLAYSSALSGSGVALGRWRVVSEHIAAGRLVAASPHPPLTDFRYFICSGSDRLSEQMQLFVQWLKETLESTAPNGSLPGD